MSLGWHDLVERAAPRRPAGRGPGRAGPHRRASGWTAAPSSPGTLYVAVRGSPGRWPSVRGRRGDAAGRPPWWSSRASSRGVPELVVRDGRRAALALGQAWYGYPGRRLTLIGVTGTNGKTTTTGLIRHLFNADRRGRQHRHAGRVRRPGRAGELHGRLAHDAGPDRPAGHVRRAASRAAPRTWRWRRRSHSLDQGRLDGLELRRRRLHQPHPRPSRLPRHHGGLPRGQAQAEPRCSRSSGVEVVNLDDDAWRALPTRPPPGQLRAPPGRRRARHAASCSTPAGSRFRLEGRFGTAEASLPLLGRLQRGQRAGRGGHAPWAWAARSTRWSPGWPRRRRCRAGWNGSPTCRASCCATTRTRPTRWSARSPRSGRSPAGGSSWCSAAAATATAASARSWAGSPREGADLRDRHLGQPAHRGSRRDHRRHRAGHGRRAAPAHRRPAGGDPRGARAGARRRHRAPGRQGPRDLPGARDREGAVRRAGDRPRGHAEPARDPLDRGARPRGARACRRGGRRAGPAVPTFTRMLDRHARDRARRAVRGARGRAVRRARLSGRRRGGGRHGGVVVREGTPVPAGRGGCFEVADTLRAFGLLARARRREITGPVVAVTGTNGKTSTKEMLAAVLGDPLPGLRHAGQPQQPGGRAAHDPGGAARTPRRWWSRPAPTCRARSRDTARSSSRRITVVTNAVAGPSRGVRLAGGRAWTEKLSLTDGRAARGGRHRSAGAARPAPGAGRDGCAPPRCAGPTWCPTGSSSGPTPGRCSRSARSRFTLAARGLHQADNAVRVWAVVEALGLDRGGRGPGAGAASPFPPAAASCSSRAGSRS